MQLHDYTVTTMIKLMSLWVWELIFIAPNGMVVGYMGWLLDGVQPPPNMEMPMGLAQNICFFLMKHDEQCHLEMDDDNDATGLPQ